MENIEGGIKRLSLENRDYKRTSRMLPAKLARFLKQLGTDVGEVVILDSTSGQVGEKNQLFYAEDTKDIGHYTEKGWN